MENEIPQETPGDQPAEQEESTGKKPNPFKKTKGKIRSFEREGQGKKGLTPKQRLFIQYYTDPTSPTFNQRAKSYQAATGCTETTAQQRAYDLLRMTHIDNEIRRIFEAMGAGVENRAALLQAFIEGRKTTKTKQYAIRDGKRKLVSVTEQQVTPRDQLRAIEVINKMDGTYEKVRVAGQLAQTEYGALRKELLSELKKEKVSEDIGNRETTNEQETADEGIISGI